MFKLRFSTDVLKTIVADSKKNGGFDFRSTTEKMRNLRVFCSLSEVETKNARVHCLFVLLFQKATNSQNL